MWDRRSFLLSGAAAAYAQNSEEPIKTGMVGVGNRGSYLLRGVLDQSTAQVAAICDLKPDRLDKAATTAAKFSPKTYRDYHDLLADKTIKAVFIATPCDLHVEMAIAALRAGKHVYCEKPAGITPESIVRLIKVARESKTVFQVGQQMRSTPRLQKVAAAIATGKYGSVVMVKAQRHAGDDLAHDGPSADWFFDAKRSGDVLVEMSVHNLDVCNWMIGAHPSLAAGFGGALVWKNDPPGRTNMDGYSLTYDYPNGVKLSYTQVFFHPRGLPGNGQYFYVYTNQGAIDVSTATFYPRERNAKPEVLAAEEREPQHAHIAAFYECIRTGKKPPAGIVEGATGALTAILGREAIYRKKVMDWKDFGVDL